MVLGVPPTEVVPEPEPVAVIVDGPLSRLSTLIWLTKAPALMMSTDSSVPSEGSNCCTVRIRVKSVGVLASAVVVHAPPGARDLMDLWGPVPSLSLMRAVKDQFDPGHRMAPGRFAGGI